MGFTESRKKDGSKVVRPTGKGAGSTFINLGKDSAREGIEDLDIPEGVEPTFDDEDDDSLSVDEVYEKYKAAQNGEPAAADEEPIYISNIERDEMSTRLEDETVSDEKMNRKGKRIDLAGRSLIAVGFVGGVLAFPFLGPVGSFFIMMGAAGAGAGISSYGDKVRKKAGANIAPQGKISDLWKKE